VPLRGSPPSFRAPKEMGIIPLFSLSLMILEIQRSSPLFFSSFNGKSYKVDSSFFSSAGGTLLFLFFPFLFHVHERFSVSYLMLFWFAPPPLFHLFSSSSFFFFSPPPSPPIVIWAKQEEQPSPPPSPLPPLKLTRLCSPSSSLFYLRHSHLPPPTPQIGQDLPSFSSFFIFSPSED